MRPTPSRAAVALLVLAVSSGVNAVVGQGDPETVFVEARERAAAGPYQYPEEFEVAVDLSGDNLDIRQEPGTDRVRILYRMNFNQVAEGWSWQPGADPARQDYFRFKYLPLGNREVERDAPRKGEDLPGRMREFRNVWRYAYYLAFENPYEFFERPQVEDDAGFSVELSGADARKVLADRGVLKMVARAVRQSPYVAESTTYWRATDGQPTELTLKNRYFIGRLTEILFVGKDGQSFGRITATRQNSQ